MRRHPADDCVYVRRKNKQKLIIALYVDDLLIACSHMDVLMDIKWQLSSEFKMEDLGESRIILWMNVSRDAKADIVSLSQTRYAQKAIERFGLDSSRGQFTPMDLVVDLTGPSSPCTEPYREAIGFLMYILVGTRPDLAYSISTLAKYVQNPSKIQWEAMVRVMRYLVRTKELGVVYSGTQSSMTPTVYVEADWAGDHKTRK